VLRNPAWTLGLLALAGCRPGATEVVARVGERALSHERLAELMVLAQPVPLTREVAAELASHWVHLMAFAEHMARGDSLLDSATVRDIMWLPIRQEILARWRRRLLARAGASGDTARIAWFDSTYAQRLLWDKRARLNDGAAATARRVAEDPWRSQAAGTTLATFAGGSVTEDDLARQVQYLSPMTRREMSSATDERIAEFLLGLVLQGILLAQADSAGIILGDSAFGAIAEQCRQAVHRLWSLTDLSPASLAVPGVTEADRAEAAARRVEEYLDAAAARRAPLEPVPPFLAVPLLRATDWTIVPQGLDAAVEQAQRLLAATRD
jgi:hypothetical protein